MTPFQIVAIIGFSVFIVVIILSDTRKALKLAGVSVASLALALIVAPNIAQSFAVGIGIARGADLVSYASTCFLIVFSMMAVSRYVKMRRSMTILARKLTLLEARLNFQDPSAG